MSQELEITATFVLKLYWVNNLSKRPGDLLSSCHRITEDGLIFLKQSLQEFKSIQSISFNFSGLFSFDSNN